MKKIRSKTLSFISSIRSKAIFFALISSLFISHFTFGQSIALDDIVTIDYENGVNGTSDISYIREFSGEKEFAYSINVNQGDSVSFSVNATSITGNPRMQIIMYNPSNNSEFWDSSDVYDIELGTNSMSWGVGGFSANVHLKFTVLLEPGEAVVLDSFVVTDSGDYNNVHYTPANVSSLGSSNFTFGENLDTGEGISWKQEIDVRIHNQEIQRYKGGYVGTDDNDNLVLRLERINSNTYYSSRVNSSIYNGIKVGSGEKLSVEFEAQLPMAKDSNGNYVPNVPLWPALWLMGNDRVNNTPVGWPWCAEIDAMEWSPTKGPSGGASGYETQANVAYHWNGADSGSYNHWSTSDYYDSADIYTQFHKWRVDIYRYDDGINTNKIEIFMNDEYISGSRFSESAGSRNKEFWYPYTSKDPQIFGSGDKEYFLIMNIALGGLYPQTSSVPTNFDHAEMVVKSVTYNVTPLQRFTLGFNYDSSALSISKTPNQIDYEHNTEVLVEVSPNPGYVLDLTETDWTSNTIVMDEDKSFTITSYPDFNDDDGDGLNNYNEAVIYNSDLNDPDTDNDNSSDYFESIAGTSLIDASDYFYMQSSMDNTGLFNIGFNTKSGREYSISVSDDLTNWYNWKTESGDGNSHLSTFDPVTEIINGLDSNSQNFFFKVNIGEEQDSGGPGGPGGPGGG